MREFSFHCLLFLKVKFVDQSMTRYKKGKFFANILTALKDKTVNERDGAAFIELNHVDRLAQRFVWARLRFLHDFIMNCNI